MQVRLNKAACEHVFLQKTTLPPFTKFNSTQKDYMENKQQHAICCWLFTKAPLLILHIINIPCQEVIQSDLHYSLNAHSVNIPHGEILDSQGLQDYTERESNKIKIG